jgi:HD-GYP domain-containing protein (c-di-GMP phosphodiesterase class II)
MREKELLELGMCALSIDHGLTFVPAEILAKAGALSDDERAVLKRHPHDTIRHFLAAGPLSPALRRHLLVAFELRLGFDRSGYPRPLLWPEQHPFTRVIALADGYDALRSVRPWRPARSAAKTFAVLKKKAGRQYDPMLVEELEDMLKAYRFEDIDV